MFRLFFLSSEMNGGKMLKIFTKSFLNSVIMKNFGQLCLVPYVI